MVYKLLHGFKQDDLCDAVFAICARYVLNGFFCQKCIYEVNQSQEHFQYTNKENLISECRKRCKENVGKSFMLVLF